MKLTALLFALLAFIGPCDTDESSVVKNSIYENCFQVKTVASICGEAVLEIQTDKFKSLGEEWNGNYNVFFTTLPCGTESFWAVGSVFNVRLLEKPAVGECIRCSATIGYTGARKYSVAVAEDCP